MTIQHVRRGFAVIAATSLLGGVAACNDSGKSAASNASPSSTAQSAGKGTAAKSGPEILAAARNALAHARSVHMKGTFADKSGPVSMDLRMGQGTCSGSLKAPFDGKTTARAYLRCVDGKIYIRSPQMIRAVGGAAAAQVIGDRWFFSSKGDVSKPFEQFVDPAKFAEIFTAEGDVPKAGTKTVNGVPVIGLKDSEAVLYVATTGEPYPIRLEPTGASATGGEHLDFLDYNAPLKVVAPAHPLDTDHPNG